MSSAVVSPNKVLCLMTKNLNIMARLSMTSAALLRQKGHLIVEDALVYIDSKFWSVDWIRCWRRGVFVLVVVVGFSWGREDAYSRC